MASNRQLVDQEAEQQVKDHIAGPHEKQPTEEPAPSTAPAPAGGT